MAPKIAIVFYSMYGHIKTLAEAEKKGIEAAGGKVDLYQVEETLPQEVLTKMHAPSKEAAIPTITPDILEGYDGFLLGIPTRYGNFPAQWKAFWDKCGKQWGTGAFQGKSAGLFISTASLGGGQESTAIAAMSTLTHLGIIYVPLGYAKTPQLLELDEIRGGSPWGAGTFSGGDGSRQPTAKELAVAEAQGAYFFETLSRAVASRTAAVNGTTNGGGVAAAKTEIKPEHGDHGAASGSQPTAGASADKKEAEQVAAAGEKDKKTLCGIPVPDKCIVS